LGLEPISLVIKKVDVDCVHIWNPRLILTGLKVAQRWKWKKPNQGTSEEDMVEWYQRGYLVCPGRIYSVGKNGEEN